MARAPKYVGTSITLKTTSIKVYASPKVLSAFREVSEDMTLYKGVRLVELLEAVYNQGLKNGARAAFEKVDEGVSAAKKATPHRNPGKPRKSKN